MRAPVVVGRLRSGSRRVVIAVFSVYLTLCGWGLVALALIAVPSGSMTDGHWVSPGVLLEAAFAYPHRTANGRTTDTPVTVGGNAVDRVVADETRILPGDVDEWGPLDARASGHVHMPEGISVYRNGSGNVLGLVDDRSRLEVQVTSPVGWKGRLLVAVPPVVILAGLGVALLMFRSFIRSIFDGKPFDPENPRRLLWLGGSLVTVLVTDTWVRPRIAQTMLDVLAAHGHPIPLRAQYQGVGLLPVLVVIGVLSLAWAFRVGTRMAADTEGLV